MKLKKVAACVLSLTMVFGAFAAGGYTGNIFVSDTVSAFDCPYSLSATLENNTFELRNGQVITRNDLVSHGIDITEVCGMMHDFAQDELFGQLTESPVGRIAKHTIDECKVSFPEKLVNGPNTIYITYCYPLHGGYYSVAAPLEVNVKYKDGTADNAVQDFLPYHVKHSPLDVIQYTADKNSETFVDISKDDIKVYKTSNEDNKILVYDGQDIEKLKADFPELEVSQIKDSVQFDDNTAVECSNMAEDKTYYLLSTGDTSDEGFSTLCEKLKGSEYGSDVSQVKFVSSVSPMFLDVSFNVQRKTEPIRDDLIGVGGYTLEESETTPGLYYVKGDIYNQETYISYVFNFCEHTDWNDLKYSVDEGNYPFELSYCYLQSLDSQTESANKDAFGYSCVSYPEPHYVAEEEYVLPDIGRDFSLSDLTLLSQYLLGDIKMSDDEALKLFDLTEDGEVSLPDLAMMKQYICMEKQ